MFPSIYVYSSAHSLRLSIRPCVRWPTAHPFLKSISKNSPRPINPTPLHPVQYPLPHRRMTCQRHILKQEGKHRKDERLRCPKECLAEPNAPQSFYGAKARQLYSFTLMLSMVTGTRKWPSARDLSDTFIPYITRIYTPLPAARETSSGHQMGIPIRENRFKMAGPELETPPRPGYTLFPIPGWFVIQFVFFWNLEGILL